MSPPGPEKSAKVCQLAMQLTNHQSMLCEGNWYIPKPVHELQKLIHMCAAGASPFNVPALLMPKGLIIPSCL